MKKKRRITYLLILIFLSLQLACQDRLIVLWDEASAMEIFDSMQIIEGSDPVYSNDTMQIDAGIDSVYSTDNFQAEENQTESPVDIVMVIDNSGSMGNEIDAVRSYINNLSNQLDNSNIDYRFVMISLKNGDEVVYYGINVPAPLGTSNRFKHIDINVSSTSALKDIIDQYDNYSNFLRPQSILNFIIITDDISSITYSSFKTQISNKGRPNFTMHAIAAINDVILGTNLAEEYIAGADDTGGVKLDISTPASQWGSLFNEIVTNIMQQIPPTTTYNLNSNPVILNGSYPEQSFTVTINGNTISNVNNWIYNSSQNVIEFTNSSLLQDGDYIEVNYAVTAATPPTAIYHLNDNPVILNGSNPEQSFTVTINGNTISNVNNWVYNSSQNAIEFINFNILHDGDSLNVNYTIAEGIPPHSVYFLEQNPIISDENNPEESFTVLIDGNEISSQGKWKYNPNANSIVFLDINLLKEGGTIEVYYYVMP